MNPPRWNTDNETVAAHKSNGLSDALSTIPAADAGTVGFFGTGGGKKAGAFGWRTGSGRKRNAIKNGASRKSEVSVDLALQWLADHQETNGSWDPMKWEAENDYVGGAKILADNAPLIRDDVVDFYYIYYGSLAMFQMGGDYWKGWNELVRDPLLSKQVREPGDNLGSWEPVGGSPRGYADGAGRVYSTAMAALSLEVYYRYLPMYK